MVKRTAEGMVEADLRNADMETGERTCRSRHVRDPRPGHPVGAVAHFDVCLVVDVRVVCQQDAERCS